jgi:hypothetical protein
VLDPASGETITFDNICYAFCEGYTQNNIVDCSGNGNNCDCQQEGYNPVCVLDPASGETITFDNICYAFCEGYTQNNIVDCSGNGGNCEISNLTVTVGDCISTTAYSITLNFDITNYDGDIFFVSFGDGSQSSYSINDLPVTIDVDVDPTGNTGILVVATPNNTCQGTVVWDIPSCQ